MIEGDQKLKPWQAIPAPPVSNTPPSKTKPELQKTAKTPVGRSNVQSGPPEYSAAQILRIKNGIKAGRLAMEKRGANSGVFVAAFCNAGGFQVPGLPHISDAHLRVLGSIVLMWLEGPDYGILKNWRWITESMIDALRRETNRALQEVSMFGAGRHPDAYGWRFIPSQNSVDHEACLRLAECDNYGLGKGVFPLDEILVFQPIYDRAYLEVVYRDEVFPPGASVPIPPMVIEQSRHASLISLRRLILVGIIMLAIGYLLGIKK